jgi:DNA-directed RNA polymerase sigma subunit (sigma70/sigma32)
MARPEYGRQVGAKISDAKRRRDEAVSEQLRQLPATAWNAIPEPDRSMLRCYYGLDSARPATLAELMATFGLQHRHVRRMVAQGTLRLIDPDAAGGARTPHEERVRQKTAVQARLASLPEGALAGLAEVDRQIIVRFDGLDGGLPGRQRAIARDLGVSRKRVKAALARASALAEVD